MGEWRGVELDDLHLSEPCPGGLRLRPYRPEDVPAVHAAMQDRGMHEFLVLPDPYTAADAQQFCTQVAPGKAASGSGVGLAMTVGDDDTYVGGAGLDLPGPLSTIAEIGYSVAPAARGVGLAGRAARLLAAWGLAHGVERVQIRAAVGNTASARAALRAGFRFEAIRRSDHLTPAGVVDGVAFSRVRGDSGDPVAPWLPPMTDAGDDVVALRPFGPGDAHALAVELADPVAARWQLGRPVTDPAATAAALAGSAPLEWLVGPVTLVAVVDRASDTVVGHLQVRREGPPGALRLGYGVLPAARGRGITVRALRAFAAWAFAEAGAIRVDFGVDADNAASLTVAERAGFAREGVARGALVRCDGTRGDNVLFGLVRPDGG